MSGEFPVVSPPLRPDYIKLRARHIGNYRLVRKKLFHGPEPSESGFRCLQQQNKYLQTDFRLVVRSFRCVARLVSRRKVRFVA